MTRPTDVEKRRQLLTRLTEVVLSEGMSNQSLGSLGKAVGTSPRMLVHYFGTADKLRVEVMNEVSHHFRMTMSQLPVEQIRSPRGFFQAMQPLIESADYRRTMTVFFELFGIAAKNPERYGDFANRSVAVYLPHLNEIAKLWGVPESHRQQVATALLTVGRGLSADLVATGDFERVNAALEMFIETLEMKVKSFQEG